MCGIFGFYFNKEGAVWDHSTRSLIDSVSLDAGASWLRGRDTFGCVVHGSLPDGRQGEPFRRELKIDCRGKDERGDGGRFQNLSASVGEIVHEGEHIDCILFNFRGVPTTETNARKFATAALTDSEIQPFSQDSEGSPSGSSITHNGLISNDKELNRDLGLDLPDDAIDTKVLLGVLEYESKTRLQGSRRHIDLRGSHALAYYQSRDKSLTLSRDYRALYLRLAEYYSTHGAVGQVAMFSSEPFDSSPSENTLWVYDGELGCNSWVSMREDEDVRGVVMTLVKTQRGLRDVCEGSSVIAVLSGGLDSTTCAYLMAASPVVERLHLMHFDYGCKATTRELEAVQRTFNKLRAKYPQKDITLSVENLDWMKRIGGSTLTDDRLSVTKGEQGQETASEWVPARNLVMISYAAAFADAKGFDTITLGLNMEESSVYGDNSSEFYNALNVPLLIGTRSQVQVVCPLGNDMKHHIVRKAVDAGVDFNDVWSCYEGGETRCGRCGPCRNSKAAFTMANIPDPHIYSQEEPL